MHSHLELLLLSNKMNPKVSYKMKRFYFQSFNHLEILWCQYVL